MKDFTTVAGADISYDKDTDVIYAGIVILGYPQMVVQSYSLVEAKTTFPYISGYLGFRINSSWRYNNNTRTYHL